VCIYRLPPCNAFCESYRLNTFRNFPQQSHVSARLLASNGFYYTGCRDRVKCFWWVSFVVMFLVSIIRGDSYWDISKFLQRTYSLHFHTCFSREGRGASNPRTWNTPRTVNSNLRYFCRPHTRKGPSFAAVSHAINPWLKSHLCRLCLR